MASLHWQPVPAQILKTMLSLQNTVKKKQNRKNSGLKHAAFRLKSVIII